MHGIHRKPYQTTSDGKRINCVEINDHNYNTEEWFVRSVRPWPLPTLLGYSRYSEWDFVLVVPWNSVRLYWSSNDGMQAWRHRQKKYLVPDHCRQTAGCPEMWTVADVKGKRELQIDNLDLISRYIVFDHKVNVSLPALPEHLGTVCSFSE